MGEIYNPSCSSCGYRAGNIHVGSGMDCWPEYVIGSCMDCSNLTSVSIYDAPGPCELCGAPDSVFFTSFNVRPRETNQSYDCRLTFYQCPVCKDFTVERGDTEGVWS